jgi:hypothetical protein
MIAHRTRTAVALAGATLTLATAAPTVAPAAAAPAHGAASVDVICRGCVHRHRDRRDALRHRWVLCRLIPRICRP